MDNPKTFDALSAIVFMVGIYEGPIPFVAKLFGAEPVLSVPSRLGTPTWWIVSALVVVVAIVALARIDDAKRHALAAG